MKTGGCVLWFLCLLSAPAAVIAAACPAPAIQDPPPRPPSVVAVSASAMDSALPPAELVTLSGEGSASSALSAKARSLGLRLLRRERLRTLGWTLSVYALPPDGGDWRPFARVLLGAVPGLIVADNARFAAFAGSPPGAAPLGWSPAFARCAGGARLGLIDGLIEPRHSVLAAAHIRQFSVLPAGVSAGGGTHAAILADLLVGPEIGLLPGAELVVAAAFAEAANGVYSQVEWLALALERLLERQVRVVNLSLGGPDIAVLHALVRRATERGVRLVAAAGNNGPGGPPAYPAAYPEVLAVSAVDEHSAIYAGANQGAYIDLVAPGVGLRVPTADGDTVVSGTSYATPYAAALLAALPAAGDWRRHTRDLGAPGRDPVYGEGLVQLQAVCAP